MVGDTTAYDGIASGFHYHKDKGTMVLLQLSGWQKGASVLGGSGGKEGKNGHGDGGNIDNCND